MAEILVPADAEPALVAELNAHMPDLGFDGDWGTRIPNPRPGEFGRIVAVGGSGRDLVTDSATVTVEAFAESETRAQRMCAFGVAVVQAASRSGAIGGVPCYVAQVFSLPANLPMPSVPDRYRFSATLSVDLRRTTV